MIAKTYRDSRYIVAVMLLAVGVFWTAFANAQSVTIAMVEVNSAGTEAMFVDPGGAVGKCPNKVSGNFGCLKLETGNSGPLNFVLNSPGWSFVSIQIREPFANWLDTVPANIRDEFKQMGGPNHGSNFFGPDGEHTYGANVKFFNINDLNTPGNSFEIQYRVFVTDGTTTLEAHPIIENEG